MSYTSTDLEYEKQLTTSSTCSSEYTSPHKKELHPNVTYTPKKRNVCRKLFDDQDEFIQQLANHLNKKTEENNTMEIDEGFINDLNLLGMYKIEENLSVQKEEAFFMLSQKESVSNHLKKTKFCHFMIKYGKCDRKVCDFAHSLKEYHHPTCAFSNHCTKNNCEFKHPHETNIEYEKRIHFIPPFNI
jgi:hypothetical protein